MANDYSLIRVPREPGSQITSPIYGPPLATSQPSSGGSEYYWRQVRHVLQKHWRFSLTFTLTFLTGLTVVAFLMKDVYEATARIVIESPLEPESVTLRDSAPSPNDQDYLQTQIEILRSDALAIAVIRNLHLDQNSEIVGKSKQHEWMTALLRTLRLDGIFKKKNSAKSGLEIAVSGFGQQLSVDQVRNSRLVEVGFASGDPQLAAQVTNALVNLFVERTHRSRYEATMQAAESLSGELEELRAAVSKANKDLVDFQNANGILDSGNSYEGQGSATTDNREDPVAQKVNELNRQLTQAQTERIQQEAYLKMIESGKAETLPQMRENLLLQDLSRRLADSRAQLASALAVFGKNNPNAKKLQNQTDEVEAQVNAERQRVVGQVRTAYQAALARERLLTQALGDMKGTVDATNEKMIQYNLLKRNAQATSNLYLTLSNRLKEVAISGSLKSSNIRVLDEARIPNRPTKPHRLQIIALGMVLGVLAGVALAFVKESFDDTVYTPDDVRVWTGLPSLAMFPLMPSRRLGASARPAMLLGNNGKKLEDVSGLRFFSERPCSAEAEAVRSLDTSIRLSSRLGGDPLRVILLASAFPNEGKSTVAVNLATALAQHSRTCLLDADLRDPVVARSFGLSIKQGLQDVLTGSAILKDILRSVPDVANLSILPAGPVTPPNPGELVASERMGDILRWLRERFDYVVIDSPPLIPYADGRWLSSLSDGVVLVARCGSTTRQAMIWSAKMLAEIDASVLGVVLNGVEPGSGYYEYGYGQRFYTDSST